MIVQRFARCPIQNIKNIKKREEPRVSGSSREIHNLIHVTLYGLVPAFDRVLVFVIRLRLPLTDDEGPKYVLHPS